MAVFSLTNAETANTVGIYASMLEALSDVAATARRLGPQSPAVTALVLAQEDVPPARGFVAEGPELVRQALAIVPEPWHEARGRSGAWSRTYTTISTAFTVTDGSSPAAAGSPKHHGEAASLVW